MKALLIALAVVAGVSPAAASPTLRELVELSDLSSQAVSPDGRWVAFRQDRADLQTNRLVLSWWIVPADGGAPARRIGDGGTALWNAAGWVTTEAPQWSPDGRWIYYRALIDGSVAVWRAAADGSGAEALTQDEADVESFTLEGDTRLAYVSRASREAVQRAEARAYDEGVLLDATVDPAQNLFSALEINGRLASQRLAGPWFGRGGLLADQPPRRAVLDLKTKAVLSASPVVEPPAARPGPNDPYVVGSEAGDARGRVDLSTTATTTRVRVVRPTGEILECLDPACAQDRIAAAAWLPGRQAVLLTTSDRARAQTLRLWELQTGKVRTVAQEDGSFQGGAVQNSNCAPATAFVVCVVSGPLAPPRLERIDLATGARRRLAAPNRDLPAAQDLEVRRIDWTDETGQVFAARLLTAKGLKPRAPLFITYYNCRGYLRGATGDEWPLAPLAAAGVATLCINMARPAGDAPDSVAEYETALRAVRSIIDRLDREGVIDRRKVGMGGLSFGSEVAFWVAMKSDLLAAISTASVQIEPTYYWLNGLKGRDVHDTLRLVWGLGAPDQDPERWRQITPAANVANIKAPVLMQMPEQEYRASIELIARLSTSSTPSEVRVFANEPHILIQPRHRLAAYGRNLDWFRFWLQGYEDPNPAKLSQYRRWRSQAEGKPQP